MVLKKSVLHQPQNSREFFAPGPRSSLAMLQPLRRSWVDFHMTTTTPSYKEYKKSIRTQIKTRPRQKPTFSTPLAESGLLFQRFAENLTAAILPKAAAKLELRKTAASDPLQTLSFP
jgi:hypothetical protein